MSARRPICRNDQIAAIPNTRYLALEGREPLLVEDFLRHDRHNFSAHGFQPQRDFLVRDGLLSVLIISGGHNLRYCYLPRLRSNRVVMLGNRSLPARRQSTDTSSPTPKP